MATFIGSSKANTITGSGNADTILALGGADTIKANGGNDLIVAGAGGNDKISGGAGVDTLVLNGAFGDYVNFASTIVFTTLTNAEAATMGVPSGTAAIRLTGPGGVVELITGVETIVFDDKVIQIVGAGSDHTVQSAVDAASNVDDNPDGGQAIFIGAGTFDGNVTIAGSQIEIFGQGAGTIINGSLTLNSGGTVDAPLFIQDLAVNGGVTIGDQSHIVLDNMTLSNGSGGQVVNFNGVGTADDITITNAIINETSGQMGLKVADGATVTGLTVSSSTFNGGQFGIYLANDATTGDTVSGTFENLTFNGQASTDAANTSFSSRAIYAEKLTDSTITGITVNAPASPVNDNLRGIELNLKNGTFANITIDNVDFVGFNTAAATGTLFDPLLNIHTKPTATLDGLAIDAITGSKAGGTSDADGSGLSVVSIFAEAGAQHITDLSVTNLNVGGNVGISTTAYTTIALNTVTGGDLVLTVVDQPAAPGNSLSTNTVSGNIVVQDVNSVTLPEGADNLVLLDGPFPLNFNGTGNSGDNIITGNAGNNILDGAGGDDTFIGGAGIDTVIYGAGATISRDGTGHWQVTDGAVIETLTGIEKVQVGSTTYLLVDKTGANVGGFQTLQSAVDAAGGGETILVAPGAYTETANYDPSNNTNNPAFTNPVGLLVNHSVTIQGVNAVGAYITDANGTAATVTSAIQSNWGTNFFVTAADVTINGLKFVATDNGGGEVNKAFEVVEDNFTLTNSFVTGPAGVPVGATVYINDDVVPNDLTGWVSDIATFHISNNVFEGDFVLANGAGYGIASPTFELTNNHFQLGSNPITDYNWGIIITGQMAGVPWRLAPVALPDVTGNTFDADYTTDRLLYARDDSPANLPNAQYVQDFIANNNIGLFAYATTDGETPSLFDVTAINPYGAGDVASHGFVLALSAGNASSYASLGNTLLVQSGADSSIQTIVVDSLTVDALVGSTDLNLELGGGVITLSLTGAQNVDVTGNAGNNIITGNDGINVITGGGGNDTILGNAGSDTAVFSANRAAYTVTRIGPDIYQLVGPDGTDTVYGVENFQFADGTLSAEAVFNDAPVVTTAISDTSTDEDAAFTLATASHFADQDTVVGDVLAYSFTGPSWLSINTTTGVLSGTPANGDVGTPTVTVTATDLAGANVSTNFVLTVVNTNDGPTVTAISNTSTNEDAAFSLATASHFADDDTIHGDVLHYSVIGPAWLSINSGTGVLSGTPTNGDVGTPTVTVTATDIAGAHASASFVLTVVNTNDGPVAVADSFGALAENAVASFDVLANDTDADVGDTKSIVSIGTVGASGLGTLSGGDATTLSGYFTIVDNKIAFNPGAGAGLPGANVQSVFDRLDPGQTSTVTVSYTMQDNHGATSTAIATFTVNGASEIFLGTANADTLNGTAYVDEIDGLTSDDTMAGGLGNDIYYIDSSNDVVNENLNEGTDTVVATADFVLSANVENLTLAGVAVSGTGNSGANILSGNAEDNVLDGAGGSDTYAGGLGGDTYFVDNTSELTHITENFDEGVDTIISRVNVTTLAANVENIVLEGTASNATGNALDNYINGNTLGNILDGGAGNDTLVGGLGNDTYIVDSSLDDVVEISGQGTDLVKSTAATYTLTSEVENLTLLGTAGISGTGNSGNNVITGNTGANTLDGGAGNDSLAGSDGNDTLIGGLGNDSLSGGTGADAMTGGDGDDIYYVDNGGDAVTETNAAAAGGADRVFTSISYTLGANVEHLFLTFAPTALINGTGNTLNNTIQGNDVANSISGLGGNDVLRGGLGNDTLTGGTGADFFVFDTAFGASNIDTITDFAVVDDTIQLENAIFTGLGLTTGTLAAAAFFVGAGAGDATDRIIYDNATGNVFYDADGTGSTVQVQIAHMDLGLLAAGISNLDFQVI